MRLPRVPKILLVLIAALAALLAWDYLLRPERIAVLVEPQHLLLGGSEEARITISARTKIGWRSPFGATAGSARIIEGSASGELVGPTEGSEFRIRPGRSAGRVTVEISVEGLLLPYHVTIEVDSPLALTRIVSHHSLSLIRPPGVDARGAQ
jgi:hypothetical protein